MIRKGHVVYTKEDLEAVSPEMTHKSALIKLRMCMLRQNRLIDELLQYESEAKYIRRKVFYLEKRVSVLNNDGNYHNFSYVDKTLRKQQNERRSK